MTSDVYKRCFAYQLLTLSPLLFRKFASFNVTGVLEG